MTIISTGDDGVQMLRWVLQGLPCGKNREKFFELHVRLVTQILAIFLRQSIIQESGNNYFLVFCAPLLK